MVFLVKPPSWSTTDSRLTTFLDLGCLTAQVTQVVQLGTANVTAGQNLDVVDVRCVNREGTLHADAERHLADGKGLTDAGALATDNNATEHLDTGLLSLDDLHVDINGIAGAKLRNIVAQLCSINLVKNVHKYDPSWSEQRNLAALPWRALGRFVPSTFSLSSHAECSGIALQHPSINVDCYNDGFRLHSAKQTTSKLLHYSSYFSNSADATGVSGET